ncbi:hypothetical protein V2I01_10815 [Micromonospora sp. BRA006-A]|nr:hypothetical protein [Micromonospora sp. BRA006-A]
MRPDRQHPDGLRRGVAQRQRRRCGHARRGRPPPVRRGLIESNGRGGPPWAALAYVRSAGRRRRGRRGCGRYAA